MAFRKGKSGNPAGRPKGALNKEKPLLQKLREAFGRNLSEKDCDRLVEAALTHAVGDVIISENADGTKQTAKVVSDPRLLLGLGSLVTKSEEKNTIQAMPILDGLRKELEEYGKPDDTATA